MTEERKEELKKKVRLILARTSADVAMALINEEEEMSRLATYYCTNIITQISEARRILEDIANGYETIATQEGETNDNEHNHRL